MPRKSTITQLDPRIRAELDRLIREGAYTIDSLVETLKSMGGEASRSAVGRYAHNVEMQMETYRQAQAVAKSWVGELKADPEGDVGRLLTEMLRTLAFSQIGKLSGSDRTNSMDVMLVAKALKDLAGAEKLTIDRIEKIKRLAREEAAQAVDKVAKNVPGGLTRDVRDALRKEILGVPES